MLPGWLIMIIAAGLTAFVLFVSRWDWSWMLLKPKPNGEKAKPPEGADMGNYGADDGR